MKIETIVNAISKNHPGSFFRISYETELPVKASYKKQGIRIIKIVDQTVRTSCKYKSIKNAPIAINSTRPNNFEWIMRNSLSYNNSTNKFYLNVYPIDHGANRNSKYVLIQDGNVITDANLENIRNMVIDSYWNKSGVVKKQLISTDNVKKISFANKIFN